MMPQQQKEIVRQGYDKLSHAYRADDTPDDHGDYALWVGVLGDCLPEGSPVLDMPLVEHPELFGKIALWLRPSGYLLGTVGHSEWAGEEEAYLGVPGGRMCWSHADEATNVRWIEEAGLHVHWMRFVPEGDSGHTLVLAQKPPIAEVPIR